MVVFGVLVFLFYKGFCVREGNYDGLRCFLFWFMFVLFSVLVLYGLFWFGICRVWEGVA